MGNFKKLLVDALKKVSDPEASDFDVFIKIDGGIDADNISVLGEYGVKGIPGLHWARGKLSKTQIEKLEQEPWVAYIELFKAMDF